MKASTLFTLTVALLFGLGVAAVARAMGLFNSTPQPAPQEKVIKVLVAKQNLYEGIAITPSMVAVRDLRQDEYDYYNKNKKEFTPASTAAVNFRVPIHIIEAGQPILRSDLEDLRFPDGITARINPGMRAVNLALPRERAAGGLITRGDFVDVLLTSHVCDGVNCKNGATMSAFLARGLRVVVKRNSLWEVLRTDPANQPIAFTLEANPYRAALIEFSAMQGLITLVPVPSRGAAKSTAGLTDGKVSYASLDSVEYRNEDERVDGILQGKLSVSETDLERIFRLRPVVRTPPPPPPLVVRKISGNDYSGVATFAPDGSRVHADPDTGKLTPASPNLNEGRPVVEGQVASMGYRFRVPLSSGAPASDDSVDCPTCNKK
jgi:Flp pilus assembly protein CpaB